MQVSALTRCAAVWPGKGRPLCQGLCLLQPDFYRTVLSFLLVCLPGSACLYLPAWELLQSNSTTALFYAGCVLLTASLLLMLAVSLSNPGFLPQQNAHFSTGPVGAFPLSALSNETLKFFEIPVNGVQIRLKFCKTCKLLRPPRASHCPVCGVCVERFDHHCPWVGNCIGKKNYVLFVTFLCVLTANQGYMWGICLFHILKTKGESEDWGTTIDQEIAEVVLGAFSAVVKSIQIFLFAACLSLFHFFLIARNETTYERIKKNWKYRGENPFNTGCPENCIESLCPLPSASRFSLREMVESAAIVITKSSKKAFFSDNFLENRSFCAEKKQDASLNASEMVFCLDANSTKAGSREAPLK